MPSRSFRRKRGHSSDLGRDRAVITVVLLAVTTVLVIIGFAGRSDYFTLPGPTGWLYVGLVIIAAVGVLVWLFFVDGKPRKANASKPKPVNPRSKRIRLR